MIMVTLIVPEAIMTIEPTALHKLLAWTSPGYPIGAFSYSHGLEQAVEDGAVSNVEQLVAYVSASLERGSAFIDAVMFAHAWRATHDSLALHEIADEAAAWRSSSELALESRQQGAAFLATTRKAWPHPDLETFAAIRKGRPIPHAVVVALACALHGVTLATALEAFLHGFAANLISAGVRLVPLGQTDGQIALARLVVVVSRVTQLALEAKRDDIGASAAMLDLFSMRHETQYTRLFRS
jgi:urease accessory protein